MLFYAVGHAPGFDPGKRPPLAPAPGVMNESFRHKLHRLPPVLQPPVEFHVLHRGPGQQGVKAAQLQKQRPENRKITRPQKTAGPVVRTFKIGRQFLAAGFRPAFQAPGFGFKHRGPVGGEKRTGGQAVIIGEHQPLAAGLGGSVVPVGRRPSSAPTDIVAGSSSPPSC